MVTQTDLQSSYIEATQKLIPFAHNIRQGKTMKLEEVKRVFKTTLWEKSDKKSGHVKKQHKVTHIIVEFQGHTGSRDNVIKDHIKLQLLNQVQNHLNILSDTIFRYATHNWKTEPDYNPSLVRYQRWNHRQALTH